MKEQFAGAQGRGRLANELARQELVSDRKFAEAFAASAVVEEFAKGGVVIGRDDPSGDLVFILVGTVSIQVSGREVARRRAGQHVGEMALIDPIGARYATVVAVEATTVARIKEADFVQFSDGSPSLWRNVARPLCVRLRELNALVEARNARPQFYIGCSVEALPIAEALQSGFTYDKLDVNVWTDKSFEPSNYTIESLEFELSSADFAALVLSPDDEVTSRAAVAAAPRDNIVFELGLFMGALGRRRTFMVKPRLPMMKIPTDLLGLTTLDYDSEVANRAIAMAPVCSRIRERVAVLVSCHASNRG